MYLSMVPANLMAPLARYQAREDKDPLLLGVPLLLGKVSCRIQWFLTSSVSTSAQWVKNQAEGNEKE